MRGTHSVGSLLRLFLAAAFLCLAWVLLSATTADASEGPHFLDGVAPVVSRLQTTTATTVDSGVETLKAVAATVPALERPIADLADEAVAVADAVPVVGRNPIVEVRLPAMPAVPSPPMIPEVAVVEPRGAIEAPAKSVAPQGHSARVDAPVALSREIDLVTHDSVEPLSGERVVDGSDSPRLGSGAPDPYDSRGPWPSPQSAPMPPTQPGPNPGGGAPPGDFAALGQAIVLPSLTMSGPGSSDWRVPRGLPSQPGFLPD